MARFGRRGEWWFVGQVVLMGGIAVSPPWPGGELSNGVLMLGMALMLFGLNFAVAGLLWLGPNLTPFPAPISDNALVTSGPYAVVRHPIYTGLLLLGAGWAVYRASPAAGALTVVLFAYLNAKSAREERWLCEQHPQYPAYAAATPRLIPGVY